MPPSTRSLQRASIAVRPSSAFSIRAPSAAVGTRRSISQPASGAMTLGREPPQIGAAFSVIPPGTSTMSLILRICRASSFTAEAPASKAPPACEPTPSTRSTNRPTPLRAVTQAPPGPAGSAISTHSAWRPPAR